MVIFVCGIVTGALLTRTMGLRTEPVIGSVAAPAKMSAPPMLQMQRANFLKVMDKQLNLSAEQRELIGKIMKASQERTQPLWNQISPQMNVELKAVSEEIRAVLTPDQRKKFGDLMKRSRKADGTPPGSGLPSRPSGSTTSATNAL
jgi:Spy/CpxP family protein refolding chaperone